MSATPALSGARKVAMLMVALGEEASAGVLKHLPEEEIERVAKEMHQVGEVRQEAVLPVLKEFLLASENRGIGGRGGNDFIRRLLERSLGVEGSRRVLERVAPGEKLRTMEGVEGTDPQHLAKFIQKEHPQTIAMVLAHLEPANAAQVLALLPEALRGDVSVRMASLDAVSPEVIERISRVLQQKLKTFRVYSHESYGGVRAVASLLNRMERDASREVLEEVEAANPDLALSIRNLMFVFDDLLLLDNQAIREVLQRVDKKVLALALKGTAEELHALFLRNMSERAGENLREEMDMLGPVKLKDVEEAQSEIVEVVRKLEEEGLVSLGSGAEEYVV
jgi:flagellar motor switch protein FliG